MKTVTLQMFIGRKITINCEENDSVDIRCGGPRILGFDFIVDAEEGKADIEKFIRDELRKNNRPCQSIHISGSTCEVLPEHIWTHNMISKCIKSGY